MVHVMCKRVDHTLLYCRDPVLRKVEAAVLHSALKSLSHTLAYIGQGKQEARFKRIKTDF